MIISYPKITTILLSCTINIKKDEFEQLKKWKFNRSPDVISGKVKEVDEGIFSKKLIGFVMSCPSFELDYIISKGFRESKNK